MNDRRYGSHSSVIDLIALFLALLFTKSVIDNSLDLIRERIKNAPNSYALIVSIILILSSARLNRHLSILNVIGLTIMATSGTIWILGVHK